MIDDLFHRFLIEGGQVCFSVRSGGLVTMPDHWWDLYETKEWIWIKERMLAAALDCKDFPGFSVAEVAEQLQVPYRYVLELIRFQNLGTIKFSGVIQVYRPSVDEYIKKLSEKNHVTDF